MSLKDYIYLSPTDRMSLKDINVRLEIWNERDGITRSAYLGPCEIEFVRSSPIIHLSLGNMDKNKISSFFLEDVIITLSGEDRIVYQEKAFVWGLSQGKDSKCHLLYKWTDEKNNKLLKDLEEYARQEK